MRAIGWTSDNGACGFYRIREKLRGLEGLGWSTTAATQLDPRDGCHVLVTQRVHSDLTLATWRALRAANRFLLVADMDDDLWRVPRSSPAYDYWSSVHRQDNLRVYLRLAHLVTVSTEPLAARIREEVGPGCPPIAVVPNTVPADLLSWFRPANDQFTIGWNGSDTHAEDWQPWVRPVREFLNDHPDARLRLGGWVPRGLLGHSQVEFVPWQPVGVPHWQTLTYDVGLAPLVPGGLNESKSPLKVLEYAARGIPSVASFVGPYMEASDLIGWHADTPREIREALEVAYTYPDARRAVSESVRPAAAALTTEAHAQVLSDLYTEHVEARGIRRKAVV